VKGTNENTTCIHSSYWNFNPILVAARMLKEAGHETGVYTSVIFRDKIEKAGVRFLALPEDADQGWRDLVASILEKHKVNTPPSADDSRLDLATQDVFPHGACAEAQYLSRFAQCEQVISDR
jgi:hypothetical protein